MTNIINFLEVLGFKHFTPTAESCCYCYDNLLIRISKGKRSYRVNYYFIGSNIPVDFNELKSEEDVKYCVFECMLYHYKDVVESKIRQLPLYYQEKLLRDWCEANGKNINDANSLHQFIKLFS